MVNSALTVAVLGLALLAAPLPVSAATRSSSYAPADRPGPPLSVPAAELDASLTCTGDLASSGREPVLLVPGTTTTPESNFSWNYERTFTMQHVPWCAVTLPDHAMGDIQIAGEYVVYAIRTMHALSQRKIEILGHSQGGMVPRWALRFWPDTRAMVDDVIGMAPSNNGTVDAYALCPPLIGCAPAIWQQEYNSPFVRALNSDAQTFAGISYTQIYTKIDEIVIPNLDEAGSSSLHTGAGQIANIAVQNICPGHITDHLLIGTADPVAYAVVMDALTHPGPAVTSRIDRSACNQLLSPAVNPATFAADFLRFTTSIAAVLVTTPHTPSPPKLASYVFG
jgi:triacylglycerol esterase/lipase EstA (alpha/beta hydrolase family)